MFAGRQRLPGWLAGALVLLSPLACLADTLVKLPTRPDVTVPVFVMPREGAAAVLILLPGGSGGFGALVDGAPSSANFLVRSRDAFADAGFHVAIMGRASDKNDLDTADRVATDHLADIRAVIDAMRSRFKVPVWLVGTSRGTVSATAAAIAMGGILDGIVLTSSVVSYKKIGAIPRQNLASIKLPVLVVHHVDDGCALCAPHEVGNILSGLSQATIKKQIMIRAGGQAQGDPCEALHHHGFIGQEREVVGRITDWVREPSN